MKFILRLFVLDIFLTCFSSFSLLHSPARYNHAPFPFRSPSLRPLEANTKTQSSKFLFRLSKPAMGQTICLDVKYENNTSHGQNITFIINDDDEFNSIATTSVWPNTGGGLVLSNSTYFELGCYWGPGNVAGHFELDRNGTVVDYLPVGANAFFNSLIVIPNTWACGDQWHITWFD